MSPKVPSEIPLKPDEDLVGVIQTANGNLDILVERVDPRKAGKILAFLPEDSRLDSRCFPGFGCTSPWKISTGFHDHDWGRGNSTL